MDSFPNWEIAVSAAKMSELTAVAAAVAAAAAGGRPLLPPGRPETRPSSPLDLQLNEFNFWNFFYKSMIWKIRNDTLREIELGFIDWLATKTGWEMAQWRPPVGLLTRHFSEHTFSPAIFN